MGPVGFPPIWHQDLYKTAIEFLKLEKIELGGVRGNTLGNLVAQIYEEVFELVRVFADCKYDPLDPGDAVSAGATRRGPGDCGRGTPTLCAQWALPWARRRVAPPHRTHRFQRRGSTPS